jgi:hypothetical protein
MTTEIKKALLPPNVADRIDDLRGYLDKSNEYIAELWMRTGGGVPAATTDLQQVSFDTLMVALIVGYERELTDEERAHADIRKEWADHNCYRHTSAHAEGYAEGIEYVLDRLSVKITEVNA